MNINFKFCTKLILVILSFCIFQTSYAYEVSAARRFFNAINFSFSAGYGLNFCKKSIVCIPPGCVMIADGNTFYLVPIPNPKSPPKVKEDNPDGVIVNWFSDEDEKTSEYPNITESDIEDMRALRYCQDKGMVENIFSGIGHTFPITMRSYFDIRKKLRIGFGGTIAINTLRKLKYKLVKKFDDPDADDSSDDVMMKEFYTSKVIYYSARPFILLGFKIIENNTISSLVDLEIGFPFLFSDIKNAKLIEHFLPPDSVGSYCFGLTLEKHISEYFRAIWRVSYSVGNKLNTKYPNKILLTTSYNSLVLEMGFSMNCPELPRCTVTDCEINIKHRHGSEPYRGESMFIGRNKRSERLFKK